MTRHAASSEESGIRSWPGESVRARAWDPCRLNQEGEGEPLWRFSESSSPASSSGCSASFSPRATGDNIPLWLTVLCGIGGVLIGYYLAAALGVDETRGIDWIRWIISIVVAAILVVIAATITGRRTGRRI